MSMRIQIRRGTAAQWTAANSILAEGELGFETDTRKLKIGNGILPWTLLEYFGGGATANLSVLSPLLFDSITKTLSLDAPAVILDGGNI